MIASTAEKENNFLSAESLTYSNLENRSNASTSTMGLSAGVALQGGQLANADAPLGGLAISPNISQPAKEGSSGVALATLTPGNLTLTNQTQDLASLNTDLSNANTQADIFDIDRLKAKQQSAAALSQLLNEGIGDLSSALNLEDGSPEKIALHAAAGALAALAAGGDVATGALAGGAQELIGAVIGKALMDNPDLTQAQRNALSQWAAVLVGAVVGGEAGAATALDAEVFNRQLHIEEAKLIAANAALYAVEQGYCDSVNDCDQSAIDLAIADLTAQAIKQIDVTGEDIAQNDAAAAFLDSIAPGGSIPDICPEGANYCGQQWFHASGDAYYDTTINAHFFEDTVQFYNLASQVYNTEHVTQIDIAESLARNAAMIAAIRSSVEAVDQSLVPWEIMNGVLAGAGGPFAVKNKIVERDIFYVGSGSTRSKVTLSIDGKISGQIDIRGWTRQEIEDVIALGATGTSVDLRSAAKTPDKLPRNDPATVFGTKSGYIVVNNRTGEVVQVSDKTNPEWSVDDRIQWK